MRSICSPNWAGSPGRWPGSAPCWRGCRGLRSGTALRPSSPPTAASRPSPRGARRTWRQAGWTGPMGAASSPPWHGGSEMVPGEPGGGLATGRAGTIGNRPSDRESGKKSLVRQIKSWQTCSMGRVQNGWIFTSAELKAQQNRALAKRIAATRIDPLALEDHLNKCRRETEKRGEKFTKKVSQKTADEFIAAQHAKRENGLSRQTTNLTWLWVMLAVLALLSIVGSVR